MIARRQIAIFGSILIAVLALLFLVYFLFIRAPYVPLFENLRESDASVIAKELGKQGIAFELGNGGHDILVPEPDMAKAKLAIAGSDVPVGGTVGFELFNESDMGLTEFAQKVNYQRALQGELARTIMTMRGVKFARVHLALPEKTIFRAAQTRPTAAVTVQTSTPAALTAEQVQGIQQLVASSVPDMALDKVAILDDRGDLLNIVATGGAANGVPVDEKAALEQYARVRVETLVAQYNPRMPVEVKIFASRVDAAPAAPPVPETVQDKGAAPTASVPATALASEPRKSDNFRLRAIVRTANALTAEDADYLRNAIIAALGMKQSNGDVLIFEVGPLGFSTAPQATQPVGGTLPANTPPESGGLLTPHWGGDALVGGVVALLLAASGLLFWWSRRRQRLTGEEQQSFAALLADELAVQQGPRHG